MIVTGYAYNLSADLLNRIGRLTLEITAVFEREKERVWPSHRLLNILL